MAKKIVVTKYECSYCGYQENENFDICKQCGYNHKTKQHEVDYNE